MRMLNLQGGDLTKMFHVKRFGKVGAEKSYKGQDGGLAFERVRLIDFPVQFAAGGGDAPMAPYVAGTRARCKFVQNKGVTRGMPKPPPLRLVRYPRFDTGSLAGSFCTGILNQEST